jgi:hypothetical protein
LLEAESVEVGLLDLVLAELVEFGGTLAAVFKAAGFDAVEEFEQSEEEVFLRRFADGLV